MRSVIHTDDADAWIAELTYLDRMFEAYLDQRRLRAGPRPLDDREAEHLVEALLAEHEDEGEPRTPRPAVPRPSAPPSLARTLATFELDEFERDVLVLALAPELDGRYGRLIAAINDHPSRARPTVGLAMELAGAAERRRPAEAIAAFLPDGRLVRHGLVELEGDGPLGGRALRAAESFWPRLVGREPVSIAAPASGVPRLHQLALDEATRARALQTVAWLGAAEQPALVLVLGAPGSGRDALADALVAELARPALRVGVERLDAASDVRAVARDARWHGAVVIVHAGDAPATPERAAALAALPSPVVWIAGDGGVEALKGGSRELLELRAEPPDLAARCAIWERFLAAADRDADIAVAALAARFPFGPRRIEVAARMARGRARVRGASAVVTAAELYAVCRELPEHTLGGLARKLQPPTAGELVVPLATRRELELIEAWARHGRPASRSAAAGRGLACLFHGPPGTGKTLAAQHVARAVGLDLYRIDLSQVVSKYIGETEKNLGRVFDEARAANLLLFFDEADALFGKRTEVRDAHDRYANIETGFLLQRLESHDGLVILASNLRNNLDSAFLRRLQVVAEFPLPGPAERRRIWEGTLPAEPERDAVELELLAGFAVSGGEIKNTVDAAMLLAAAESSRVGMPQLTRALWRELRKSGRLVDAAGFGRWRDEVLRYAGVVTRRPA